jgi:hypothetical protein
MMIEEFWKQKALFSPRSDQRSVQMGGPVGK